jgi:hypothetical protein
MSYITFKTIGESGNLGSQLQQYASLYAVARANNKEIVFPESSLKLGFGFKFANLIEVPIVTKPDEFFRDFVDCRPNDAMIVDNGVFGLDPTKNYNIVNRFDLFHYWHPKYKNDILQWSWNKDYLSQAVDIYNTIPKNNKQTVAIHVRRGDYLLPQHDHFCKLGLDYYTEALQPYIEKVDDYHFVIFSNDIEWCKESLIEGEMVTFIEPGNDYVDLILMSLCDHFIIANSSYSWWAAMKGLNENKKEVTCPMNYLKQHSPWSHINTNYYPSEWKAIQNNAT